MSGQARFSQIVALIRDCRWGVHDLSRNASARFNMPLELGVFLGANRFGGAEQRGKACLALATREAGFREAISDTAGRASVYHEDDPVQAIIAVRNWLNRIRERPAGPLPGGKTIAERYARFRRDLPRLCEGVLNAEQDLTFTDYCDLVSLWLKEVVNLAEQQTLPAR